MQKIIKDIIFCATNISVIIGVLFAILQYHYYIKSEKISASMEYVAIYNSGEALKSRNKLLNPWLRYDLSKISGRSGSKDAIDRIANEVILLNNGLEDLMVVVYMIDRMYQCIKLKLCDENVIYDNVCRFTEGLVSLYGVPIEVVRKRYFMPDFGNSVKNLYSECKRWEKVH